MEATINKLTSDDPKDVLCPTRFCFADSRIKDSIFQFNDQVGVLERRKHIGFNWSRRTIVSSDNDLYSFGENPLDVAIFTGASFLGPSDAPTMKLEPTDAGHSLSYYALAS